ncbi:hypothetical protein HJC23_003759 [Cyclotella cryptica]|uniref:Uncharacterized protein n=1 Tax=Cyclotella cryptica TaxID=29204 RepID=A0ABD3QTX7_9STRA
MKYRTNAAVVGIAFGNLEARDRELSVIFLSRGLSISQNIGYSSSLRLLVYQISRMDNGTSEDHHLCYMCYGEGLMALGVPSSMEGAPVGVKTEGAIARGGEIDMDETCVSIASGLGRGVWHL